MIRTGKILIVFLMLALGLWGCARKPAPRSSAERVRSLESRCVKLEQDYRAAAGARDQIRKQFLALEESHAEAARKLAGHDSLVKERDALRQELRGLRAERDTLKQQVAVAAEERESLRKQLDDRVAEREVLVKRMNLLKKGLQSLISSDEGLQPHTGPSIGGL